MPLYIKHMSSAIVFVTLNTFLYFTSIDFGAVRKQVELLFSSTVLFKSHFLLDVNPVQFVTLTHIGNTS
jgi:hypothetical protein